MDFKNTAEIRLAGAGFGKRPDFGRRRTQYSLNTHIFALYAEGTSFEAPTESTTEVAASSASTSQTETVTSKLAINIAIT